MAWAQSPNARLSPDGPRRIARSQARPPVTHPTHLHPGPIPPRVPAPTGSSSPPLARPDLAFLHLGFLSPSPPPTRIGASHGVIAVSEADAPSVWLRRRAATRARSGRARFAREYSQICWVSGCADADLALLCTQVARGGVSPPWREDDRDGHYVFDLGENLTRRCERPDSLTLSLSSSSPCAWIAFSCV